MEPVSVIRVEIQKANSYHYNLAFNQTWEVRNADRQRIGSVPRGADAYLLRWILHDWADPEAAAILGSLRRAMKPTARLVVVENVIPEGESFHFGKWIDLQMLVCLRGRERTEAEYRALLTAAGFVLQEVVATP